MADDSSGTSRPTWVANARLSPSRLFRVLGVVMALSLLMLLSSMSNLLHLPDDSNAAYSSLPSLSTYLSRSLDFVSNMLASRNSTDSSADDDASLDILEEQLAPPSSSLPVFTVSVPPASSSVPPYVPVDYVGEKKRMTVIVAGAQKCGTTVMAAYLASHPDILMSSAKEIHYFDDPRKMSNAKKPFDSFFPLPQTSPSPGQPLLYGVRAEATPFYIASSTACRNIASSLLAPSDDYRLLLMLREPVDRLWSEYMMEMRRIEDDLDMISLLVANADDVFKCYVEHVLFGVNDRAGTTGQKDVVHDGNFIKCLPPAIALHPKVGKLRRKVIAEVFSAARLGGGGGEAKAGFRNNHNVPSSVIQVGSNLNHRNNLRGSKLQTSSAFLPPSSPPPPSSTAAAPPSRLANLIIAKATACFKPGVVSPSDFAASLSLAAAGSYSPALHESMFGSVTLAQSAASPSVAPNGSGDPCLGRFVESVLPPSEAFRNEMSEWNACLSSSSKRSYKSVDRMSPSDLAAAVGKCYANPSRGISRQFVYRSMYAPQLERCVSAGVPREKILVVDSLRFKKRPRDVMKEIHEFVGVEDYEYELEGAEDVQQVLSKRFPKFEAVSGWTIKGDYDEMPEELREELREFFVPFNKALLSMVGRDKLSFDEHGEEKSCAWCGDEEENAPA